MKALVKEKAEPGLWLMDVPEPEIGPGDVLIKVLRTGICGTDLHIRSLGRLGAADASRTPLVVGHEFVGEVVETGRGRRRTSPSATWSAARATWSAASAATAWPAAATCAAATVGLGVGRDGAFAEYVALPASNVWVHRIPVDLDVAAIFDPFGNAVHTALSFPLVGEDVLITGAGPDRADGRRRGPARRRPQRRRSPTSARSAWSWPARSASTLALNVSERRHRRRTARARAARGLRRRPGDVRPPRSHCAT